MSVSDYTIAVGPWTGSGPTQELTFYSSWVLDKNIDDGCTFSFSIPGYAPEASAISELDTDVWVYRGGVLNQRFRIIAVNQQWGPSGEDVISVQAVCYRRLLATRYVQSPLRFDNVSQGQIIWQLIQHTQATTNGDMGITLGNAGPTVLRDRFYESGQNILDIIVDMTNVIGGPTWDINENLELVVSRSDLYPTNPAPLVLGATVESFQRPSAAAKFGNVALVSGNQQSTTTVIATSPNLSGDPRGRWEKRASYPTVILQDTLTDHANGLLTELQAPTSIWQVDVVPQRYFGDGDYKLGDFVELIQPLSVAAQIGTPAVKVTGQIIAIQVGQDSAGKIDVSMRVLEIGPVLGRATGGDQVFVSDGYYVHLFTNSGTFTALETINNVEYLVIAGGGGGGGGGDRVPGGGGAGGYRSSVAGQVSGGGASAESALNLVAGPYTVVVGAGGPGGPAPTSVTVNAGSNGSDSVFHTITAVGGGGGGGLSGRASTGGSGGGGAGRPTSTGVTDNNGFGTANQGYDGGDGRSDSSVGSGQSGAGGGGAGAVGGNGSATLAGNGGAGASSNITGFAVVRAGGGGGTRRQDVGGSGGNGGGGNGAVGANAQNGLNNTGSGGGAASSSYDVLPGFAGGNGGKGVVIVRYPV